MPQAAACGICASARFCKILSATVSGFCAPGVVPWQQKAKEVHAMEPILEIAALKKYYGKEPN